MLQAGFARVTITPPLGCPVDGYFKDRSAKGVLDELELNAVAFSDGECCVVMIAADMLGIMMQDVAAIKEMVSAATGLKSDCIMLSALHQHTSIFFKHQTAKNLPVEYANVLYRKFADVAKMAIADLSEATLFTGEKETAEPIGFVRRYYLSDGRVATNPKTADRPLITGRCDESDNTVRVLRLSREGKPDIAVLNFSTHPDVVGGEYYSADWPGFARRFVEAELPETRCLFFTGAEGDSNHVDFMGEKKSGYEHSRHMGRLVADAALSVWHTLTPRRCDKVQATVTSIFNKSNTVGEEQYEQQKAFYADYFAGKLDFNPTGEQLAFARRVIHIREEMGIYRELPISAVSLGEVVLVGFAGEPFTDYGREVRRVAGDRFALTLCLTNGYQGYLPTAKAFAEGGYEAANSHFTPTLQAQAIAELEKILQRF